MLKYGGAKRRAAAKPAAAATPAATVRPAVSAPAAAAVFVVGLLLVVGLPIAYLAYLARLERKHCVCATSHRLFRRLRWLVAAQLALTLSLPLVALLPDGAQAVQSALSTAVMIAQAAVFLAWFRAMLELKCVCSDGWERSVWMFMSVFNLTVVVLSLVAALLVGASRR